MSELIRDRVWRTRSQLELADYIGWHIHARLHESLDYSPPLNPVRLSAPAGPAPGC
jgi:hypothetical protein